MSRSNTQPGASEPRHASSGEGFVEQGWVQLERLDGSYWCVSDSRIDDADPARLLGYVERLGRHRYEALRLSDPVRWDYCETLEAAIADLVQ
jgi:hypothetical protein